MKGKRDHLSQNRTVAILAEKYEVEDLVKFCLDHLLTIENAIDFLKTSYLINKKEVFDFGWTIFLQAQGLHILQPKNSWKKHPSLHFGC